MGVGLQRTMRYISSPRAYFERACSVCDDLVVAFFRETLLNADDIADRLRMKKLERDRFLQAIAAATTA